MGRWSEKREKIAKEGKLNMNKKKGREEEVIGRHIWPLHLLFSNEPGWELAQTATEREREIVNIVVDR